MSQEGLDVAVTQSSLFTVLLLLLSGSLGLASFIVIFLFNFVVIFFLSLPVVVVFCHLS